MDEVVLWHIPVSHYNEKVRWALDYKRVEHERRAPPPPFHMAIALWLTRGAGKTFPLLQLGGEAYGDSTEAIAALERFRPEPPLYPEDPDERRRALELEDFFDEQVGSDVRLLAWHEVIKEPGLFGRFAVRTLPPAMRWGGERLAGAMGTTFVKLRYGVADVAAAARARERIAAGMDRLEAELGDGDYLVGDRFTVADLTAASLLYPIALPDEGPQEIQDVPAAFEEYRRSFEGRRAYEWIGETFRRHRSRGASIPVTPEHIGPGGSVRRRA